MNKLYRSERDKKIFGLCGGLAQWLNVDATLIRVLFVIAGVFSAGSVIFVYVLASLVIPKEPTGMFPPPGYGGHGYYGGYNGAGTEPCELSAFYRRPVSDVRAGTASAERIGSRFDDERRGEKSALERD